MIDLENDLLIAKQAIMENDNLLLTNSQLNITPGIHYGYMTYSLYYLDGVEITNYKIQNTNNDLDIIIQDLSNRIITSFEKKLFPKFLVYQVENIDPRLVSYNIIMSSTFHWAKIHVRHIKNKEICYFYGNNLLLMDIWEKIYFLKNYNQFLKHLQSLRKNDLELLFKETFRKKPKYIFNKKKKMFNALLKNKKKEFVQNL